MTTLRAVDLFCGAGGSSTGLSRSAAELGISVSLTAINHWERAIETHAANHPGAEHICESLDSIDPRKIVTGRLDLLMASPECTHHSAARGGKPMSDQSRSTAWHVLRWAEALRPAFVMVENVKEFRTWGPLGCNGRPLQSRRGETFEAWLGALRSLGYTAEHRVLNAADFGAATTRERLFILGRLDGGRSRGPLPWPDPTHGSSDLFADRSPWRAAREIVDWSLRGESIFSRKKPLAEKTLARITEGARRFWGVDLRPFLVPFYGERPGQAPRTHSLDDPLPTVVTDPKFGLIQPFLLGQQSGGAPRGTEGPAPTVATKGAISLIEPFLVAYYGSGTNVEPLRKPLRTLTTRERFGIVSPTALDVTFRMLRPHELSAAMGFPEGYEFAGTRSDAVRMIGNAVEVNQAAALTRGICESVAERLTA